MKGRKKRHASRKGGGHLVSAENRGGNARLGRNKDIQNSVTASIARSALLYPVLFFVSTSLKNAGRYFPWGMIYGTIETFEIAFKTTSKILLLEEL